MERPRPTFKDYTLYHKIMTVVGIIVSLALIFGIPAGMVYAAIEDANNRPENTMEEKSLVIQILAYTGLYLFIAFIIFFIVGFVFCLDDNPYFKT